MILSRSQTTELESYKDHFRPYHRHTFSYHQITSFEFHPPFESIEYLIIAQINYTLIPAKSADIVGGGVWGRRPHTDGESTMLMSYDICYSL